MFRHTTLTITCAFLVLTLLLLNGCGAKKAHSDAGTILLVMNADVGSGKIESNKFEIELSGVDEGVIWFNDRPKRDFGEFTLKETAEYWDSDDIQDDPPNAVIEYLDAKANRQHIVVEIDKFQTQDAGSASLGGKLLKKSTRPNKRKPDGSRSQEFPDQMRDVEIFIDAFPTSVNSQITDSIT